MSKPKILFRLIGISLVSAFVLASCNIAAPTVAPASATATQAPSSNSVAATATLPAVPAATNTTVPTATVAPIATTAPTATAAPAATASPTMNAQLTAQVIPSINAYCRKGPGTDYYQITFLQQGTAYNVTGRNSLNTWWQIQAPGNLTCWMGDPNPTKQGPVDQVSIVPAQPLPLTPATFVDSYTCNTTLNTLGVVFNWSAVANVTGYRIYRNGTQITDASSTATSYTDSSAPMGVNLVYQLEAHNDYGVAARYPITVPACG